MRCTGEYSKYSRPTSIRSHLVCLMCVNCVGFTFYWLARFDMVVTEMILAKRDLKQRTAHCGLDMMYVPFSGKTKSCTAATSSSSGAATSPTILHV